MHPPGGHGRGGTVGLLSQRCGVSAVTLAVSHQLTVLIKGLDAANKSKLLAETAVGISGIQNLLKVVVFGDHITHLNGLIALQQTAVISGDHGVKGLMAPHGKAGLRKHFRRCDHSAVFGSLCVFRVGKQPGGKSVTGVLPNHVLCYNALDLGAAGHKGRRNGLLNLYFLCIAVLNQFGPGCIKICLLFRGILPGIIDFSIHKYDLFLS